MSPAVSGTCYQVNGCSLYVVRRGSGSPLYAVHGGPGLDHTTLAAGMSAVERHHEVFYIDLRGHGRSEGGNPLLYTFQQMVEDLDALRVILGHEKVSLLGHSMGGKVSILYALQYPARLDSLVIVSASPIPPRYALRFLSAPGRVRARFLLLVWAFTCLTRRMVGLPWCQDRAYLAFWARCWTLYSRRNEPSDQLRSVLLGSLKPPFLPLSALSEETTHLDISRVIDAIQTRTLVLCGDEDVLFSQNQHLFRRIPGASIRIIPDAGHFPHIDQPERFGAEVLTFLRADLEKPRA